MPIPLGGHSDWLFGLGSFIPRSSTAIEGPPPPHVTFSRNFDRDHNNPDVPNKGAWVISEHPEYGLSFSCVLKYRGKWWLIRVGSFRYDYGELKRSGQGYYTFPTLAFKKVD